MSAVGCASMTQSQYFEVIGSIDPITGEPIKSYYRMSIKGNGNLLSAYNLRATYVSATTVDSFNGKLPTIPVADLPRENENVFDELKREFMDELKSRAERVRQFYREREKFRQHDLFGGPKAEKSLTAQARALWFSSLSDTDLISLGQIGSTNPFVFRKLVFYATASSIDLREYESTLTSAINKTATLARRFKHGAKAIAPPTPITNLKALPSEGSVTLTWKNPSESIHTGVLVVKRDADKDPVSPTSGSEYVTAQFLDSQEKTNQVVADFNDSQVVVDGLTNDKPYTFDIYSYNPKRVYGTPVSVVATPAVNAPQSVEKLELIYDDNKVKITFSMPSGSLANQVVILRYDGDKTINRHPTNGAAPTKIEGATNVHTGQVSSEVIDQNVEAGKTYVYAVYAVGTGWIYSPPVIGAVTTAPKE